MRSFGGYLNRDEWTLVGHIGVEDEVQLCDECHEELDENGCCDNSDCRECID